MYRRTDETHRLQVYPREKMVAMLEEVGFEVRVVEGYGTYRFEPKFNAYAGYVARKPGHGE